MPFSGMVYFSESYTISEFCIAIGMVQENYILLKFQSFVECKNTLIYLKNEMNPYSSYDSIE